ncbi:Hypothetical predicted protein [Podarcis lilfordi]|uniref:Uncharacterized protein n=1 Tax=Podarcis lilfordi TaxID=74358 RepID=A0AA35LCJ7_9SAUR|nr:Hypothetical predicted protein [Podarcis lilfordi]
MKWLKEKESKEAFLPTSTVQKSHLCFLFKLHVFKFMSTSVFDRHRSRQFYLQCSFAYKHNHASNSALFLGRKEGNQSFPNPEDKKHLEPKSHKSGGQSCLSIQTSQCSQDMGKGLQS